jgi:hypothetical protein
MSIFIIYNDKLVKIDQSIIENESIFSQRILFLITAIDQGLDIANAETLSYAFRNRLIYGVKYYPDLEKKIDLILSQINT